MCSANRPRGMVPRWHAGVGNGGDNVSTTDTQAAGTGRGMDTTMTTLQTFEIDGVKYALVDGKAVRVDSLDAPSGKSTRVAPPDGVTLASIRGAFGGPAKYGPGCKSCGRQTAWDKRRGEWRSRCPGRMLASDPNVAAIRKAGYVTGDVTGDDGLAYVTLAACERSARMTAAEREAVKAAERAHKADGAAAVAAMLDGLTLPAGTQRVRVRAATKLGRVMLDGDYATRDGIDAVVGSTKAGVAAFTKAVAAFPWADYGWKTPVLSS